MEGVAGVFGNGISPKNVINIRPTPPLSAIDRFLWGQNPNHFSHPNEETFSYGNGVSEFSLNNSYSHVGMIPPLFTTSYYEESVGGLIWEGLKTLDGVLVDANETQIRDMIPKQEEEKTSFTKKRVKGGYPSNLIKGQWTDEEDRKLIRLVKQFGVRKWAQIAEKMYGRAGKQCRERWQNHLRPDIKKDIWNEEEEKMLIEAHQTVGNKWAEIAKRIPGRSENSIKNHWNATKRRQNSRRKSKKNDAKNGKSSQPSLLQDYIKSKMVEETNTMTSNVTYSNATPSNSTTSDDRPSIKFDVLFPQSPVEDSATLITPTYDEELNFLQRLFATNSKAPSVNNHVPKEVAPDDDMQDSNTNVVPKQVEDDNIMRPDHSLAFLLDGGVDYLPQKADHYGYNDLNIVEFEEVDQASSSGTHREMDLIEMVSASYLSQEV